MLRIAIRVRRWSLVLEVLRRDRFYELPKSLTGLEPEQFEDPSGPYAAFRNDAQHSISVFTVRHVNTFGTLGGFDALGAQLKSSRDVALYRNALRLLENVRDSSSLFSYHPPFLPGIVSSSLRFAPCCARIVWPSWCPSGRAPCSRASWT